MKKLLTALVALTVSASCLAGCGSDPKFEPTESSIFAKKDGTVVSADMEDFSGDNYSKDELLAYVEKAVISYNSENGAKASAYAEKDEILPAAIESLTVENGKATLILDYASGEDYCAFTGSAGTEGGINRAQCGPIAEVSPAGDFQDKDGDPVTLDTVLQNSKDYVFMVEGPVTVQVEGKIEFATKSAVLVNENTVKTSDTGVTYIVFK